jgi:hypothetical protein
MATMIATVNDGGQVAIRILMLDPLVHTLPDRPFCGDRGCPCHRDPELIREYLHTPFWAGLLTHEEALRILRGEQV